MVNVNKLRGKIIEKGMTVETISNIMGINKSTFYRKLDKNGDGFLVKEAAAIVEILSLSGIEAADIFFALVVA